MTLGIIHAPKVIQPSHMVVVYMRQQHRRNVRLAVDEHLLAEVRSRIDKYVRVGCLNIGRCAQPLVVWVCRLAGGALASYDGYSCRGASAEEGQNHGLFLCVFGDVRRGHLRHADNVGRCHEHHHTALPRRDGYRGPVVDALVYECREMFLHAYG